MYSILDLNMINAVYFDMLEVIENGDLEKEEINHSYAYNRLFGGYTTDYNYSCDTPREYWFQRISFLINPVSQEIYGDEDFQIRELPKSYQYKVRKIINFCRRTDLKKVIFAF